MQARAAFDTAKDVAQLRQCGRTGTFTMSGESALDTEAVRAAVEQQGLKLAGAEKVRRQKAQRELRFAFSAPPS